VDLEVLRFLVGVLVVFLLLFFQLRKKKLFLESNILLLNIHKQTKNIPVKPPPLTEILTSYRPNME